MDIASIAVAIGDVPLNSSPIGEKVIQGIVAALGEGTVLPESMTGKDLLMWMDALPDAQHDKVAAVTVDVKSGDLPSDNMTFSLGVSLNKRSLRQYVAIGIAVLLGIVVLTVSFVAIHSTINGQAQPDSSLLIKLAESLIRALDTFL